jgi:hypothetical protein
MTNTTRHTVPSERALFRRFVDLKGVFACLLLPILLLPTAFILNQSYLSYRDNGIVTTGEILEIDPRHKRDSAHYDDIAKATIRTKRLNLVVSHTLDTGEQEITLVDAGGTFAELLSDIAWAVPAVSFLSYEVGDQLEFSYLKHRPYEGTTRRLSKRIWAIFLGLLGVLSPVVAWIILREARQDARAAHRALAKGTRETARVSQIKSDDKKEPRAVMHWVDGQGKPGETRPHPNLHFEGLEKGSEITIYRDGDGDRAWWEGDLGLIKF